MATYEQKLTEFAQGRRFLRLPRPVRDRADALCDACGSTRPRTLYALEDPGSKRHFFVGDSCLKELVKLGAILRYGRHSGQAEFENEMRLRSLERLGDQYASLTSEGAPEPNGPEDGSDEPGLGFEPKPIYPAIFVIETIRDYQAFAYGFPSDGEGMYAWGYAREERHREVSRLGGEECPVSEDGTLEISDPILRCINEAWAEACSGRHIGRVNPESKSTSDTDKGDMADSHSFPPLPFVESLAEMITALAIRDSERRQSAPILTVDPSRN